MSNLTLTFDEALAQFERTILSPVIPGELADWTDAAFRSIEQLRSALAENAKSRHDQIYEEIAKTDPEMLTRVERLQAEDDSMDVGMRELVEIARTIRTLGAAVNSDEESAKKTWDVFVRASETLYLRIRKQELALEVWLRESQTRDRGVKD